MHVSVYIYDDFKIHDIDYLHNSRVLFYMSLCRINEQSSVTIPVHRMIGKDAMITSCNNTNVMVDINNTDATISGISSIVKTRLTTTMDINNTNNINNNINSINNSIISSNRDIITTK
jgi:hypothetical protein